MHFSHTRFNTALHGEGNQQDHCNQVLFGEFLVSWGYKAAVVPLLAPHHLDLVIC